MINWRPTSSNSSCTVQQWRRSRRDDTGHALSVVPMWKLAGCECKARTCCIQSFLKGKKVGEQREGGRKIVLDIPGWCPARPAETDARAGPPVSQCRDGLDTDKPTHGEGHYWNRWRLWRWSSYLASRHYPSEKKAELDCSAFVVLFQTMRRTHQSLLEASPTSQRVSLSSQLQVVDRLDPEELKPIKALHCAHCGFRAWVRRWLYPHGDCSPSWNGTRVWTHENRFSSFGDHAPRTLAANRPDQRRGNCATVNTESIDPFCFFSPACCTKSECPSREFHLSTEPLVTSMKQLGSAFRTALAILRRGGRAIWA